MDFLKCGSGGLIIRACCRERGRAVQAGYLMNRRLLLLRLMSLAGRPAGPDLAVSRINSKSASYMLYESTRGGSKEASEVLSAIRTIHLIGRRLFALQPHPSFCALILDCLLLIVLEKGVSSTVTMILELFAAMLLAVRSVSESGLQFSPYLPYVHVLGKTETQWHS